MYRAMSLSTAFRMKSVFNESNFTQIEGEVLAAIEANPPPAVEGNLNLGPSSTLTATNISAANVTTSNIELSHIQSSGNVHLTRDVDSAAVHAIFIVPASDKNYVAGDESLLVMGTNSGLRDIEGQFLELRDPAQIRASIDGNVVLQINPSNVAMSNNSAQLRIGSSGGAPWGSLAAPSIAWPGDGDYNTGIHSDSAGNIVFGTQGAQRMVLTNTDVLCSRGLRTFLGGTFSDPSIKVAESNSGFSRPATANISISTGGLERMRWGATNQSYVPLHLANGNVSVPSLAFVNSSNQASGFYLIGANEIGATCNGTLSARFSTGGLTIPQQIGTSRLRIGPGITGAVYQYTCFGYSPVVASIPANGSGALVVSFGSGTAPTANGMCVFLNLVNSSGLTSLVYAAADFTTTQFTIYYRNLTASTLTGSQWTYICVV